MISLYWTDANNKYVAAVQWNDVAPEFSEALETGFRSGKLP